MITTTLVVLSILAAIATGVVLAWAIRSRVPDDRNEEDPHFDHMRVVINSTRGLSASQPLRSVGGSASAPRAGAVTPLPKKRQPPSPKPVQRVPHTGYWDYIGDRLVGTKKALAIEEWALSCLSI